MRPVTGPVFVDADVLLYARDKSEPAKRARAQTWLDVLWHHGLGRTSTTVLAEYYVYAARRQGFGLAARDAWDDVKRYFAWRPMALDTDVMTEAREVQRRHRISWRDSTVVAAARLQGCVLLLTDRLRDGASFGTLAVRSPFTLEIEQPRASYEMLAVA